MAGVTKLQLCESCKDYVGATPCCMWMDRQEFAMALTNDLGHRITYCPWNGLPGASLAGVDQPKPKGDSRTPHSRRLQRLRLNLCKDCEHFVDKINSGEPSDRPCQLRPAWNICAWKQAASTGEIAGDGCLWSGVGPPVEPVSTGVRLGIDSGPLLSRGEAKGVSGTDLHNR